MKLSIVVLLIAFTSVMATPTPKEEGEGNSLIGPMLKTGFNMFGGMANSMNDWMKGGMDFAKGMAETSKNMMMGGFKAAENMAGNMAKSVGL